MKNKILAVVGGVGSVFFGGLLDAGAAQAVLQQDTYTSSAPAQVRSVLNNSLGLFVDARTTATRRAWLQFDLKPALVPGASWENIGRATLSVYVSRLFFPGGIKVLAAGAPWSELSLGEQTAPRALVNPDSGQPYARAVAEIGSQWLSFDVTDLVRDWVDGSVPNAGLILAPEDSKVYAVLGCKEGASPNRAMLEIVLSQPSAMQGERGPQGLNGTPGRDGAPGVAGLVGAAGPAGPSGPAGAAGPAGPQGEAGSPGPATLRLLPRGDVSMGEFTQGVKP